MRAMITWPLMAALAAGMCGVIVAGCDADEDSEYAEMGEESSPEDLARALDEDGAAALAESDRGTDEEGEKIWKQDAREFYDRQKNPDNRTFEMPWQWARDFTEKAYAAGAENVWVTCIFATDFGDGNVINISDDLLIVLPEDPVKRKAIFELYNSEMEYEEMNLPDIGQKYIYIVAD